MGARVPLDVDLEDKLVFGLTPARFGYLALSGLAAMAVWGQRWAPGAVRLGVCLLVLGLGAGLAWGRWRGRRTDHWLLDLAAFGIANYSVCLCIASRQWSIVSGSFRAGRASREVALHATWVGAALTAPSLEEAP